jgi:hypothetical protein
MKTKNAHVLCLVIVTLFLASLASKTLAQTPAVNIVPSQNTVQLDEEVTVNVTVTDMPAPGLYSYELKLHYNNTLLEATNASIPTDHFLKPLVATNIFIVLPGNINQTEGFVEFAMTMLGEEPGKEGNGTLVTVTFKGLAVGTSDLELPTADLILVDVNTNPMSGYDNNPATVQIVPEFAIIALVAVFIAMSGAAAVAKKKLR